MPQKDDAPRIRDHDVPEVGGREIPSIRDHELGTRPGENASVKGPGERFQDERRSSRSSAPLVGLGVVGVLGALALAVVLLVGRMGEREPAAPNSPPPAVASSHSKDWKLYDLARPQFLEYHVWIWIGRDGSQTWTDRVDAVISEVTNVTRDIHDVEVLIRLPRQFDLSHVISPGDTIQCGEPTYFAWRRGIPGLVAALVKSGISEQAIRGPVFADCGQGTATPAQMPDDRLYRIEIWLKSPSLN